MEPLFPELPEDLAALSDEDLGNLLAEHEAAAELIDKDDEEFIKGLGPDEVMAAYDKGVEQIEAIVAEQKARVEAQENYLALKEEKRQRRLAAVAKEEEAEPEVEEPEAEPEEEGLTVEAEAEEPEAEEATEEAEVAEEERVLVTASAETKEEKPTEKVALRRPPAPSAERKLQSDSRAFLVAAAGLQEERAGQPLDRMSLARMMGKEAERYGPAREGSIQKVLMARATFPFPEERQLSSKDVDGNAEKIRAVIPESTGWGTLSGQALVASGGLCAPLEPIYSMPNFASTVEPVWASLPVFQADRGGVNVPTATIIGDITTAISSISEANDALGGTYATKSCQDLTCPAYTEVAVQILAHCREYGNLNARAWPEKIAHENDLTMAALARTSETFMLDRIKDLSIQVTHAEVIGAFADLVLAINKAVSSIRYNLRMERGARFRVLMPAWVPNLLAADFAATQFDRVQPADAAAALLDRYGISVAYYLDPVTGGTSQGFAAEVESVATADTLDDFPAAIQYAVYPEGSFIGVDMGTLELGIVRDSTLNATNDFQIFGERFRNVALLGPAQGTRWIHQEICPNGVFPDLGTALSCSGS